MDNAKKRIIAFIYARGGSKGLPKKNIKILGTKPLIAYSIEIALSMPEIETVIVSTDDIEIAKVALEYGAEVPFLRPSELAQDDSSEWDAWRHSVRWFEENRGPFDIFISLPPTSPFRQVSDVQDCINAIQLDPICDAVITVTEANRSPYFNMVTTNERGFAEIVIKSKNNIIRRQDVPHVYDVTTVAYATRPNYVMREDGLFAGRVKAIHVPPERSLDIDTPYDFMIAEAIVLKRTKVDVLPK